MPTTRAGGDCKQRLPGGDVVRQAGNGLQFGGFKGGAGDLRLCGELRGVEEAAKWDGNLLAQQEAHLAGELVLTGDPRFVGGRMQREDRSSAYRRCGKTRDKGKQRLPLESGGVSVLRPGTEWDRAGACPATILRR